MIKSALIGYTGFVGSNLATQRQFTHYYNSKNIQTIVNQEFDLVICAGVSAVKWLANQKPDEDWQNISSLINCLQTILTKQFVLISTVDVYANPIDVDETTPIDLENLQSYGKHRRQLELFVQDNFNSLVVRLPGLFGNGLKKNIIYDLLNNHRVDKINQENIYQFYCLDDLNRDLERAIDNNLSIINIATEPILTQTVAAEILQSPINNSIETTLVTYDMKTKYSQLWQASKPGYLYTKTEILGKLRKFVKKYTNN